MRIRTPGLRCDRREDRRGGEAVEARHLDVHEDHVGAQPLDGRHELVAPADLADDGDVVLAGSAGPPSAPRTRCWSSARSTVIMQGPQPGAGSRSLRLGPLAPRLRGLRPAPTARRGRGRRRSAPTRLGLSVPSLTPSFTTSMDRRSRRTTTRRARLWRTALVMPSRRAQPKSSRRSPATSSAAPGSSASIPAACRISRAVASSRARLTSAIAGDSCPHVDQALPAELGDLRHLGCRPCRVDGDEAGCELGLHADRRRAACPRRSWRSLAIRRRSCSAAICSISSSALDNWY